eukprot:7624136-Alexandrium_andersonii.AAC.1
MQHICKHLMTDGFDVDAMDTAFQRVIDFKGSAFSFSRPYCERMLRAHMNVALRFNDYERLVGLFEVTSPPMHRLVSVSGGADHVQPLCL